MVASVSSSTSGISNWTDSAFSKLDTKNQGYIEKSDLASALSATGNSDGGGSGSAIDDVFGAIDGDSDGKVTKSELSEAVSKLSDQLNAQFDAARVQGGMPPGPPAGAGGARGGGGAGGAGSVESTESTDSTTTTTSTDYVAAADTDGDGTVSDAEQAAYDKKVASGEIDKNGNSTDSGASGGTEQARQQDPARELAHALHMLKAYADNSGSDSSDASAAATSSVSVEA